MRTVCLFTLLAALAPAQSFSPLNCVASAVPALVHLEGLAERVGDIVLNCTGGTPNGTVRGDIRVISFGGNVTNKLNTSTGTLDAVLTVNVGAGDVSTGATAQVLANNQFAFASMNFNLGPTGNATLRITNVRVVPPQAPEQPFQLALATNGPSAIRVDNSPLTAGIATRGLLAAYSSTFVCTVSGLPSDITFNTLLNSGTRFASMRFTEGFSESFLKKIPLADQGTRIMARFSNFPAGARLFVPDGLAGSTATIPTAAGDLGLTPNGGRWTPTAAGQLLLARVKNTDVNGAGGSLSFTPAATVTDFSAMSEVFLSGGSGVAVFEVIDSNPTARESVQLPIFLALEQRPTGGSVSANVAASLGPISSDATPSNNPVPRFQALNPPSDCQALGDCNSGIFPKLAVETEGLVYNPIIGQFPQTRFVRVRNDAGGLLNWAAAVQYKTGSGWLSIDPPSGIGNGTIRVDATAAGLKPGIYEASLFIDAGPLAGSATLPVRMEAREIGPAPQLPPEISSVTHAATFAQTALAPGTIATLFGNRLKGDKVEVRVSDVLARIFFSNDTQINFEVPGTLPNSGTVNLFVSVDSRNSPAKVITLTTVSPGIFPNAILNQDNSVNTASTPALSGTAVQIFLTGMQVFGGAVTVKIHDYTVEPLYAGSAPGFIGLQQVNALVPATLQSITADLSVCAGAVCSPTRQITVRQP
ncbi:MAG: hypothetical protein HYX27_06660 [Acidobacteria bacterium]|nr:hypothetical protein [Acidobacteriota bacterium]